MPSVVIRGIHVSFPYEPYELQKEYMNKVIECLQEETNGVLESPTGTGKTLSLLCASLAWLTVKKAQHQAQRIGLCENDDYHKMIQQKLDDKVGNQSNGRSFLRVPTIIYASRTHSQIFQAMQELKKTAYSHMKATVIGSRDQLCINPDVAKEQDSLSKRHLCQAKVQTRTCQFYNNVERNLNKPLITELNVVDIEDIVSHGKKHSFCPYFMTKDLSQEADIIFMPYNYILDSHTRKALGVQLTNNVVILDEAHNIERICEDSASLVVTSSDITLCIAEVTDVMKAMSQDASFSSSESPRDFNAEELCNLKETLLNFERAVDYIELKNNNSNCSGTTFEGDYIFEIFKTAGIDYEHGQAQSILIDKIIQFLSVVSSDGPFQRKGNGLKTFHTLLSLVYSNPNLTFKDKIRKSFKVHIVEEEQRKSSMNSWVSKQTTKLGGRTLNFWCFNPGFGMNILMDTQVRCVILTSGTLAPLKPLISELDISIKVQLENPHIVKGNQINVKILDKGPDGIELNSSFKNRNNPEYISSLGRTILNLSRIIPNGMLIFFPSYPIMQQCQDHWQEQGIWDNIYCLKKIYVETRRKEAFNTVMTEYYTKVTDPNEKGAIFMGVCRGKISEGLDFADANGRAVLITGLPYAPLKDPRVVLKKQYLDICRTTNKEMISGDDWYTLDATRAINQAIGRVIRHQYDYGAIILLDSRFTSWKIKSQLSCWLRDHIIHIKSFGDILRNLKEFYRSAEQNLPQPKSIASKSSTSIAPISNSSIITDFGAFHSSSRKINMSSIFATNSTSSGNLNYLDRGSRRNRKRKHITIRVTENSSEKSDLINTDLKEYLILVKKGLSSDQCTIFINALTNYNSNQNYDDLIKELSSIFDTGYHIRYLIQGLQPYIKDKHKELFEKYWELMK
ncbi:hypothetical protein FQA39_LY12114 [Lamprigera yunnana]|nr:hypothetical protein FQA39_LY12114 [Lamprigera yunnana]